MNWKMSEEEKLSRRAVPVTDMSKVLGELLDLTLQGREKAAATVEAEAKRIFEMSLVKARDVASGRGERSCDVRILAPFAVTEHNIKAVLDAVMSLFRQAGLQSSAETGTRDMLGRYPLHLRLAW